MEYGKSALIKRITNAAREGWTTAKIKDLIDSLWRDPVMLRWSGFWNAGAADTILAWNNTDKIFSIAPPAAGNYAFFQNRNKLSYHQVGNTRTIDLSAGIAEGLYIFYFDFDPEMGDQGIFALLNPTDDELRDVFVTRTIIASVYWDSNNAAPVCFGNDRWGSGINPHQQWIDWKTSFAMRGEGLGLYDYIINGDGSENSHVRWKVASGSFWHGDFEIETESAGGAVNIPVLYWDAGDPRLMVNPTFQVVAAGTLCYNAGATMSQPAASGKYVMYHAFATNDMLDSHQIVSVMGRQQYDSLSAAMVDRESELIILLNEMPQTGKCYLATLFYEVNDAFTNTPKARLVSVFDNSLATHPPVSIDPDSSEYLSISDKQVLSINPEGLGGGGLPDAPADGNTYGRNNNTWVVVSDGDDGEDGREIELQTSAGWVQWRYVGDASWINLFEIPEGGSGGVIQATGTLLVSGWVADGSLFKYVLSNANITATSIVEVIPANAAYDVLVAAEPMPETVSASGTVTMWAKAIPTTDISVTINITETV